MTKLILRRLLESIPLLLAISFVTFFLLFHSPGSYLDQLRMDPKIPTEFIEREAKRLGLDRPFYEIWLRWLWGMIRYGDFGQSIAYKVPVSSLIGARLFNTFLLSLASIVFTWAVSLPLGILAAVRQDKLVDRIASALAFIGISVPVVLFALLALYIAAVTNSFPTGGMTSSYYDELPSQWAKMKDIAWHLVLPTIVLGIGGIAVYMRQMRSNLLDTLQADYVRTALAKGVSKRKAVLKHALRNALNPLITLFGFEFSGLLSGAFLVENVLAWPGLGRTAMDAFLQKDMYVVAATVLMASVMLILGNLLADILLGVNDPRIRYD